jgi:indolepyruvate ferredoxin oxidoreductase beta subunit
VNEISPLPQGGAPTTGGILKLAVMAVGGQGGGVLAGWIETLARAQGWSCQTTSVAGVAQRTGATIYYIEMAPGTGRQPVFALAPAAGDVDILVAAELMEAGRAILRGFVTPDRTTLIASTHRALAVSEKMVPGDGIASAAEVEAAARIVARRMLVLDLNRIAQDAGSVISASLFGALAAARVLPFPTDAFETAIRAGGKGIEPSLRAFQAAFAAASTDPEPTRTNPPETVTERPFGPATSLRKWQMLDIRVRALPPEVAAMAGPGLRKVVDFQNLAYGEAYLDRIETIAARDPAPHAFAREAAKHLANAMSYDDVIRVADRKTRSARSPRIATEMGVTEGKLMQVTEFLHPRAEEVVGMLPARLGARIEASPKWMARLDRWFGKGRQIRSDRVTGFLSLYLLGGLRWWRPRTRRHAIELRHTADWLDRALAMRARNYPLAVEMLKARRLVKGYSDTHSRGLSKFDRVMAAAPRLAGRKDGGDWLRRLIQAALQDEDGVALDGALKTLASFGD